jgi:heme a synthase
LTIKRLAFLLGLLTYFLIVFGGYVASSNSGMGCGPEWPLCNGDVIPDLKGATLIEFTHRVIGALLGLLTFFLFFKILQMKADYIARSAAFVMLALLIIQVLLGAIVVIWDLPSLIITIHLLIAMVFLAMLIWFWRNGDRHHLERKKGTIVFHLNILIGLLILTLGFGAYIKHQTYGLACGWLGCNQSFSSMSTPEILQTGHRGLALAVALYILVLTFWAFSKKWEAGLQRRLVLCAITVLVQLAIGVAVILTRLDIPWAVLHLAVGTAMFAFVSETRVYVGNNQTASNKMVSSEKWHGGRKSLN